LKIGIVSDSHGHADRLRAALQSLRAAGAEAIVHCGDIGSVECLAALGETNLPCYAVAGNVDQHVEGLADAAGLHGVCFNERMVSLPLGDGRELAATHGSDVPLLSGLVSSGRFAYVCCGHSHRFSDTRDGDVRLINPGALHNCRVHSAAVLDTDSDDLLKLTIARGS
jgi:putative phosphoesterase